MARLINRPHFYPGGCFTCTHSSEDFGPYLDLEHEDKADNRRVYFCRTCVATMLVPLEIAPRQKLLEAFAEKKRAEDETAAYAQEAARIPELEAENIRLKQLVERLEGEKLGLQHSIQHVQNENKRKLREALLVEVAKPKPTKSTTKPKEKTAA